MVIDSLPVSNSDGLVSGSGSLVGLTGIHGKRFLIIGGGSGIGIGAAAYLSGHGATLHGTARKPEDLPDLYKHKHWLELNGDNHIYFLKEIESYQFDGVLFTPGIVVTKMAGTQKLKDYEQTFYTNVMQQFVLLNELVREGRLNRPASVVYISSIASTVTMPGNAIYSASKAAMDRLVQCHAFELARKKIRVNAVAPGQVETPLTEKLDLGEGAVNADKARYPLGYGKPGDVAGPILFLLSDLSRWMTGSILVVDGGRSIQT